MFRRVYLSVFWLGNLGTEVTTPSVVLDNSENQTRAS